MLLDSCIPTLNSKIPLQILFKHRTDRTKYITPPLISDQYSSIDNSNTNIRPLMIILWQNILSSNMLP